MPRIASTPLDDIEFLARSDHRVTALAALARQPRSRVDLRAMTGASQSTIGRTLRAFEDRHWIRREGQHYEATQLGAFVAAGILELIDRLETEQKLRDAWQWLPSEASGFTVEMATDAVVTVADADAPYRPVHRFVSLLRETDRFRFVGSDLALLEPCKDELRRRIIDGMHTEIIDPPSVARYILTTYRDPLFRAARERQLYRLVTRRTAALRRQSLRRPNRHQLLRPGQRDGSDVDRHRHAGGTRMGRVDVRVAPTRGSTARSRIDRGIIWYRARKSTTTRLERTRGRGRIIRYFHVSISTTGARYP